MNIDTIQKTLEELKKSSEKKKFKQTLDFVATLKDLDLKNPEQNVDFYAVLHFPKAKKAKICGIVGTEMKQKAEESCDKVILDKDFEQYKKDPKIIKKLAAEYDYFIAQANLMPQIAQIFGKYLGPRGRMPNPKAGCIVNPKTDLRDLNNKLQMTVRLSAKGQMQVQAAIGTEETDLKQAADNVYTLYDQLIHHLPKSEDNVRKVIVKYTMSKPVEVPLK